MARYCGKNDKKHFWLVFSAHNVLPMSSACHCIPCANCIQIATILYFTKNVILGPASVYLCSTKFDAVFFTNGRDMAKNTNLRWHPPPSWIPPPPKKKWCVKLSLTLLSSVSICKSDAILDSNESHMANVYLRTRFYTNVLIGHRHMVQKYKSKMAAVTILNYIKSVIYWATEILVWRISVCTSNLMQICSFVTEIWPKIQIQDGYLQ